MTSSLQGWLELLAVKGLGPVTYTRLINRFGSPDAIRSSDMRALVAEGEISPSLARALQQPLSSEAQLHIAKELEAVQDRSILHPDIGRFSVSLSFKNHC